jgi:hypothetical protein
MSDRLMPLQVQPSRTLGVFDLKPTRTPCAKETLEE